MIGGHSPPAKDLEKIIALKRFMFQVSRSACNSTGAKHQDYSERTQQTSADSSTATSFRHSQTGIQRNGAALT